MKLKNLLKLLSAMMITSIVSTCFNANNHIYAESLMNNNIEEIFVAKMPEGLSRFTTQIYKNKIYLFGGKTSTNGIYQTPTVNIYDLKSDTWSKGEDIPMNGYTAIKIITYTSNICASL